MTQIEITQGDTEQLIPQDQANREYIAEISGATVQIGHTERYAKEGTEIQAGDRVKLDNLQNQPVYAYAAGGDATIRLDTAGINVEYMSRATTSNVAQIETVNEVQTVNDVTTVGTVGPLENTSTVSTEAIDPTNSFSDIAVPDGMTARVRADSANADPVSIGSYSLDPGDSITLRVTSLADIPVSGTSGDEVQAIIPGGV